MVLTRPRKCSCDTRIPYILLHSGYHMLSPLRPFLFRSFTACFATIDIGAKQSITEPWWISLDCKSVLTERTRNQLQVIRNDWNVVSTFNDRSSGVRPALLFKSSWKQLNHSGFTSARIEMDEAGGDKSVYERWYEIMPAKSGGVRAPFKRNQRPMKLLLFFWSCRCWWNREKISSDNAVTTAWMAWR